MDPTVTKLAKKLRDNQHNEEGQRLRDLLAERARNEWECSGAELAEDAGWDERLRTLQTALMRAARAVLADATSPRTSAAG